MELPPSQCAEQKLQIFLFCKSRHCAEHILYPTVFSQDPPAECLRGTRIRLKAVVRDACRKDAHRHPASDLPQVLLHQRRRHKNHVAESHELSDVERQHSFQAGRPDVVQILFVPRMVGKHQRDIVLPGQKHVPTASVSDEAAEITVTLGAPSKSFNMPGIASAWTAVVNPELREGFFAWLKASEFDTPPICAIYSTIAAYTECEDWIDDMLGYLSENSAFAIDYIHRNIPGVDAIEPRAGFGLWIDFRDTGLTHEEIIDRIINRAKLAVSDGASFGVEGRGFIRLNFGVARSVLETALERIKEAFADVR